MSESVHQDLPVSPPAGHLELHTTEEQAHALRKAADLVGWTVPEYVLSAALDRAERDLYEHAAQEEQASRRARPSDRAVCEPYVAVVTALGWPP